MDKKSIIKGLLCIVMVSAFTVTAMAAETIKIGVNVPLTGFAASDGESALNGAKLAMEQINKAGGIDGKQLELVVYDDQASPRQSVPIATKLIEKDKVLGRCLLQLLRPHTSSCGCLSISKSTLYFSICNSS